MNDVINGVLLSSESFLGTDNLTLAYINALTGLLQPVYDIVADQGYRGSSDWRPGWSILLDPINCPAQFLPYLAQYVGVTIPVGTDDQTARQIIRQEQGMARGTLDAMKAAALRNLSGNSNPIGSLQDFGDGSLPFPALVPVTSLPVSALTQDVPPQTITLTDPTSAYTQQFVILTKAMTGDTSLAVYPQAPNYGYPAGSTIKGPALNVRERWNGVGNVADAYHVTMTVTASEAPNLTTLENAVNAAKPAGIIVDYIESGGFTWSSATHTWAADTFSWDSALSQNHP